MMTALAIAIAAFGLLLIYSGVKNKSPLGLIADTFRGAPTP